MSEVKRRRHLAVLLAISLTGMALPAAEPSLTHLFPPAGRQGVTVPVKASGKFEPRPAQVWVDAPGIVFKPGKSAGQFDVEIAKDAAPGPHLVRAFNNLGASAPRFFIVARESQTTEAEPNDEFRSAQKIAGLPATVVGRLDKSGDVDSYAVNLKRGQTLVGRLEAYVLASAFDGMLRIVDGQGSVEAFNHDDRSLDPFLVWKAPRDGTFVVQVMGFVYPATADVRFTGGDGCVYRLHMTAGPFVRHTMPLAAQRGIKAQVALVGWNLAVPHVEIDGTKFPAGASTAELELAGVESGLPLIVSDMPEGIEKEPNDPVTAAQSVEVPAGITGRIDRANDEDHFVFNAVKGRAYEFRVTAARIGSMLDGWLKIRNKDGKELARNDDANGFRDPELTWTAPADGSYSVVIGDVSHHGGDGFTYRLAISEAVPAVNGTVTAHAFAVQPGKTAEAKVAVKRTNGFKGKLQLAARNLPEGVSAPPVDVPEKDGDVALKLTADAAAKPASQPLMLVLRETESGAEHPVRYSLVATSEDNGVPQGYTELVIPFTDQLWLTIPPVPAKPEPKAGEKAAATPEKK
ncbi:MAG: PPC domain-containing protein [Chthoniobacteraceae bacterium]